MVRDRRSGCDVSIHAPTKGATSPAFSASAIFRCFNPRSHEGSDISVACFGESPVAVSIHAPTKGATGTVFLHQLAYLVSIHAPTKGATRCLGWMMLFPEGFNPRPHEGSDAASTYQSDKSYVSIHAPTKGATMSGPSTPKKPKRFQSTLPRRERQQKNDGDNGQQAVSIHAPTKGATMLFSISIVNACVSIHAPTKGATYSSSASS